MGSPQRPLVFEGRTRLAYLQYDPTDEPGHPGVEGSSPRPLVLFLHGAGERGTDLGRVKAHGIAKIVETGAPQPFVAVSPQCPPGTWWVEITDTLHALVDHVAAQRPVDPSRIYLTGLSMGGFGVWRMAAERPHRYAAAVPVCGGGDPRWAPRLATVPIWAFHGDADDVVPVEHSLQMVAALEAIGAPVRLTRYPDVAHDSWTRTFEDPELYRWLLAQRLREVAPS